MRKLLLLVLITLLYVNAAFADSDLRALAGLKGFRVVLKVIDKTPPHMPRQKIDKNELRKYAEDKIAERFKKEKDLRLFGSSSQILNIDINIEGKALTKSSSSRAPKEYIYYIATRYSLKNNGTEWYCEEKTMEWEPPNKKAFKNLISNIESHKEKLKRAQKHKKDKSEIQYNIPACKKNLAKARKALSKKRKKLEISTKIKTKLSGSCFEYDYKSAKRVNAERKPVFKKSDDSSNERAFAGLKGSKVAINIIDKASSCKKCTINHYKRILEAHPDYEGIVNNAEFVEYLTHLRKDQYKVAKDIIEYGKANDVVELISSYKENYKQLTTRMPHAKNHYDGYKKMLSEDKNYFDGTFEGLFRGFNSLSRSKAEIAKQEEALHKYLGLKNGQIILGRVNVGLDKLEARYETITSEHPDYEEIIKDSKYLEYLELKSRIEKQRIEKALRRHPAYKEIISDPKFSEYLEHKSKSEKQEILNTLETGTGRKVKSLVRQYKLDTGQADEIVVQPKEYKSGILSNYAGYDIESSNHFNEIVKTHSDFLEIVTGQSYKDYINNLPSQEYKAAHKIEEAGTTEEVVSLISRYKSQKHYQDSHTSMLMTMIGNYSGSNRKRRAMDTIQKWINMYENISDNPRIIKLRIRETGSSSMDQTYLVSYTIARGPNKQNYEYEVNPFRRSVRASAVD